MNLELIKGEELPSIAFGEFQNNLIDVDRLIESHSMLNSGNQGKKGLGHITRSGVLMLCASWELYLEELIKESARKFTEKLTLPKDLPLPAQKELSSFVKKAKHELKPLDLAGDGWKAIYYEDINILVGKFNTPKVGQINELFTTTIGMKSLIAGLTVDKKDIDEFVTTRGSIAHLGRRADYVKITKLSFYRDEIKGAVIEIDNTVSDFIRDNTDGRKPWNITP